MKKKLMAILIALCSAFATIGFASCDILSKLPDPDDYQNVGHYTVKLDTKDFNPVQVYNADFDCTGLTLYYSQEFNGEVFYETTIDVRPDMITKGGKTNSVGDKTVTITYHEETWTIDYTVKYQVEFLAYGKAFDTQYVMNASEIVVPDPTTQEKDGYVFAFWKSEIPETLSGNLSIEGHYYDTKLAVPYLSALDRVYDPNATLKDIELPSTENVGKWEFVDALTTPVGGAGKHEFDVRFVPATDKLAPVANSKVTINVAKQLVDKPTISENVFTYDGAAKAVLGGAFELFTVSNNVQTSAGTYTIGLALKDPANYAWSTKNPDPTFTIEPKKVTFEIGEENFVYDGKAHFPAFEASEDIEITVSLAPQTNAGTYKYELSIKDKNYTGGYKGSFTIAKKAVEFTVTKNSFVYDGEEHFPEYTVSDPNAPISVRGNTRVEVGVNNFTLSVSDPNYSGSYRGTFEITKPDIEITVDSAEITYGEEIPEITYTVTGFTGDLAHLNIQTVKPSNDGAGVHTITVTVNNENVNVVKITSGTLTIHKANLGSVLDPVLSTDSKAATYEDLLSSVTFESAPLGTWLWKEPDTVIDDMNGITVTAIFVSQNSNFNPYEMPLTITNIAKRELVIEVTNNTYTYTGDEFAVEYVVNDKAIEGLTYTDLTISGNDVAINAGTYDRKLEIVSDCYKGSISTKLKIDQATPEVELSNTSATVTWKQFMKLNNTGITLSGSGEGSYDWKYPTTDVYTLEIGKATNFKVVFTPTDTLNYTTKEFDFTLTVEKAATQIKDIATTTFVYNGNAVTISADVDRDIEKSNIITYEFKKDGVTVDSIVNVGKYKVIITAAETAHYVSATKEVVVTVTQATNTWSQTPYMTDTEWYYSTTAGEAHASAKFGEVEITYVGDGYESTTLPTNAGSYQAIFTVVGTDDYTGLTKTVDFTITKANVTKPTLVQNSFVYTGTAPTLSVKDSANSAGKYAFAQPTETEVGTGYTVTLTLTEDYSANYVWADTKTAETTLSFNITKATISLSTWKNTSGWAFGEDVNLPYVEATRSNGDDYAVDIVYSYATSYYGTYTEIEEDTFTSASNAGTYYIKASVVSTDNYVGVSTQPQAFTIHTTAVDMNGVAKEYGITWFDGLTLSDITPGGIGAGSYAWVVEGDTAENTTLNAETYTNFKVRYTPADKNYHAIDVAVTVYVNHKPIEIPTSVTLTDGVSTVNGNPVYNGNAWSCAETAADYTISSTSATNAGETVTVTFNLKANRVWADKTNDAKTLTYTVQKADNTDSVDTAQEATYGMTLSKLTLPTSELGSWKWKEGSNTSVGDATAIGEPRTFHAVFTPNAENENNYNSREVEVEVTVAKKAVTLPTLTQSSFAYTGTAPTLALQDNGNSVGMYYAIQQPTATEVGEYIVALTLKDEMFGNYKWATSEEQTVELSFTITTATPTIEWQTKGSGTYNGTITTPTAKVTNIKDVAITYTYSTDNVNYSSELPKTAGEWYVKASVAANANNYSAKEVTTTFTIEKAIVELPTLPTGTLTYSGVYQLMVTAGDKGLYTVVITAADVADEGAIGINAGSYTVTLTLNDFDNYKWENSDKEELSYVYEIKKANLGYVHFANPEAVTWREGLKLGDITLPDGYAWSEDTATLLTPGTTSYDVIYTRSSNYEPVEGSVQVTVNKIEVAITNVNATYSATYNNGETVVTLAPKTVNKDNNVEIAMDIAYTFTHMTYDGSLSQVAQPTGKTFEMVAAGIYDVTISAVETTYYAAAEFKVRVTIAQATIAFDMTGLNWEPEPQETLSSLQLPASEFGTWSWTEGGNTVIDVVDVVEPGQPQIPTVHTVHFASNNPNYRSYSTTVSLAVGTVRVNESFKLTNIEGDLVDATYSGEDITVTYTIQTRRNLELEYGKDYVYFVDGVASTGATFTVKNAKEYTVVIKLIGEAAQAYYFGIIDQELGYRQVSEITSIVKIERQKVAVPTLTINEVDTTYTGNEKFTVDTTANTLYEVTVDADRTNVGTYNAKAELTDKENFEWADDIGAWTTNANNDTLTYSYTVVKAIVTVEFAEGQSFDYDGNAHTATVGVTVNSSATLEGIYTINDATQTDADPAHTVTITLNNTTNYEWWNGSTEETITIGTFEIKKAKVSVTFSAPDNYIFNDIAPTITVIVTVPEGTTAPAYTINGFAWNEVVYSKTAGTHTVTITLDDYDNYEWATITNVVNGNKEFTYEIGQKTATQPSFNGIATEDFEEKIEVTVGGKNVSFTKGPQKVYDGENDIPVAIPQSAEGVNITANDVTVTVQNLDPSVPALLADDGWNLTITEAGTYLITLELTNSNYSWPSELGESWFKDENDVDVIYFIYVINEAEVAAPTLNAYDNDKTTFTTTAQIPVTLGTTNGVVDTSYTVSIEATSGSLTNGEAINVGTYKVTVKFADNANENNYKWTNLGDWALDEETNTLSYTYKITPKPVGKGDIDTLKEALEAYTYNGDYQLPIINGGEGYGYKITFETLQGDKDGTITQDRIGIDAGIYTITLTLDNGNYKWSDETTAAKEFTYTINKAVVSAKLAENQSFTYNGSAQTASVAVTANGADLATMLYELSGNRQTAAKEAGYDVTVTLKDTDNYTWTDNEDAEAEYTLTEKFVIGKATPTVRVTQITVEQWNPYLTFGTIINDKGKYPLQGTATSQFTLPNGEKEEVAGDLNWGTIDANKIVIYDDVNGVTYETSTSLNATTYTFNVTFASKDSNYNSTVGTVSVVINPMKVATPSLAIYNEGDEQSATTSDPTYNGKAWVPVATTCGDYTVTYTENVINAKQTIAITFTLGANRVWEDENFTGSKAYTVQQVQNTQTIDKLTATYGQTLADIVSQLTANNDTYGTWSWETADTKVGNVGDNKHTAKYTPTDPTNYASRTEEVTVSVSAKSVGATEIAALNNALNKTYTYSVDEDKNPVYQLPLGGIRSNVKETSIEEDGYKITIKMTSGDTDNKVAFGADAGTYIITLEVTDTNHVLASGYTPNDTNGYKYTIGKATVTFGDWLDGGWTYGDTVNLPEISAEGTNLFGATIAYAYRVKDTGEYTLTKDDFTSTTNAGTVYEAKASVVDTDNYNGTTSSGKQFMVTQATLTIVGATNESGAEYYENQQDKWWTVAGDSAPYAISDVTGNKVAGKFTYTYDLSEYTFDGSALTVNWTFVPNDTTNYTYTNGANQTFEIAFKAVAYIETATGDVYYGTIEKALEMASTPTAQGGFGANASTLITVWVIPDATGNVVITKDTTIPEYVTLILPYGENQEWDTSPADKRSNEIAPNFADADEAVNRKTWVKLDQNVTLTVNGTLNIGGVLSQASQIPSGHTSGAYAEILLEKGASIVSDNADSIINCYGFIKEEVEGTGVVNINQGTLTMPFVIYDYRGGSNTVGVFKAGNVMPFNVFDMPNIYPVLTIKEGAYLDGAADLWTPATSVTEAQHNVTVVHIVGNGSKNEEELIMLHDNAVVVFDYDAGGEGYTNDQGTTSVVIEGGASLGELLLKVELGEIASIQIPTQIVQTGNTFFAVSWKYNIHLNGAGSEYNISYPIKFMSGSTLTVGEGATLNVNNQMIMYPPSIDSTLSAQDKDRDNTFCDDTSVGEGRYPGGKDAARFITYGTVNINSAGAFGGVIEVGIPEEGEPQAKVVVDPNATLSVTSKEGQGSMDMDVAKNYVMDNLLGVLGGLDSLLQKAINRSTSFTAKDIIKQSLKLESFIEGEYISGAGTYYPVERKDEWGNGTGTYGWFSDKLTISYDSNGGSEVADVEDDCPETGYEIKASHISTIPTRDHYTFTHWCWNDDCTNGSNCSNKVNAGEIIYGSAIFYAGWTADEYDINYVYIASNGTTTTASGKFSMENPISLNEPEIVTTEFFKGWYTAADGKTKLETISTKAYADLAKGYIENNQNTVVTLYALYSADPVYKIIYQVYKPDDVTLEIQGSATLETTSETEQFIPVNQTTGNVLFTTIYDDRTTYMYYFDGWYIDSSFETKFNGTDENGWKELYDLIPEGEYEAKLYGRWVKKYVLTVQANWTDNDEANFNKVEINQIEYYVDFDALTAALAAHSSTAAKNDLTVTVSKYFAGWDTDGDGVANGMTLDASMFGENKELTINAIWADKHMVTISTTGADVNTITINGGTTNYNALTTLYLNNNDTITIKATSQTASYWAFVSHTSTINIKSSNPSDKEASATKKPTQYAKASVTSDPYSITSDTTITITGS